MQKLSNTADYQNYYDEKWQGAWGDMQLYGPMSRHIRRQILRRVRPLQFKTLLDAGCGNGILLHELRQIYGDSVQLAGCDVSAEAVEQAKQYVNADLSVVNLQEEHLPQIYDLVICSETLEHIENDAAAAANLYAMSRQLIVSVPGNKFKREDTHAGHYRRYTRQSLRDLLEKAGFQVVSVEEWGFPFFSPLYRRLMDIVPYESRTGNKITPRQRLVGDVLHKLFFLNVVNKGDELFAVARRPERAS